MTQRKPLEVPLSFVLFQRRGLNSAEMALDAVRRYGSFIRLSRFSQLYLNADAEVAAHIFLNQQKNYSKDTSSYYVLMELFGRGLLTSEGERWQSKRLCYQSLFTPLHLMQYAASVVEVTDRFLSRWQDQSVIDIAHDMLILSVMITIQIFFHETISYEEGDYIIRNFNTQHYHAVKGPLPYSRIPFARAVQNMLATRRINRVARGLLLRHRQDEQDNLATRLFAFRDPHTKEPYAFVDLLDEVKTFLGTGHDTVGTVLGWAFYSLLTHPACLSQLRAEVEVVCGSRLPQASDLEDLPYTQMVFNETIRLYPPIWVLPRQALSDDEIIGYTLQRGAQILTVPYALHRLACYWSDPDVFMPQRFSKTHGEAYPKHAFIPFGAGPRICIARVLAEQQARLILTMVAQRYDLELMTQAPMRTLSFITLKPNQPILVRVHKRGRKM